MKKMTPEEMKSAEFIYIAGISVKDQLTQVGRKHGAILIYAAMVYLDTFYDLSQPKKIYAIAASRCGKNILEKMNFQIETDEADRKDIANAVLWWRHGEAEPVPIAPNELDIDLGFFDFAADSAPAGLFAPVALEIHSPR